MEDLFVYSWACDELDTTIIRCYGIDRDGNNVVLRIEDFTPYVYIELVSENYQEIVQELLCHIARMTVYTEIVEKSHLYYGTKCKFLYCQCISRKQIGYISYAIKTTMFGGVYLKLHEESATSILQLVSLRDIPTATWISFEKVKLVEFKKQTFCDKEYIVKWNKLHKSNKTVQVQPKILAFDLEVNSENINAFPSNKPNDVIFQISCVIQQHGREKRKILLTYDGIDLNDNKLLKDTTVISVENEEQLLIKFINLLSDERPNVLTGYNILMFDLDYLMKRCERYGLMEELSFAGYNKIRPAIEREIKWSSSAFKNQKYRYIDWEGILIIDLLSIIRRDYKFDNYKLDTVACNLINAEKDPVHYKEIFQAFKSNKMARVGKYCVQDSNLCIDLFNHIHCWIALSEMAVVCKVSMFTMYTQGQQIKIYSQVYNHCLKRNLVVTSNGYKCNSGEQYLGAYVMDPIPGLYFNVVPLDFTSLYPSLIINHNICYSTFIPENNIEYNSNQYELFEWEDHVGCEHDPKIISINRATSEIESLDAEIAKYVLERNEIKGTKAKSMIQKKINELRFRQKPFREKRCEMKKGQPKSWQDDDGNFISGIMCAKRSYRFLKRHVKVGVIPTVIQQLLDSRQRIKTAIKTCCDDDKIVLDKKQLAYKVSANSQYGAMGVKRGYLPFMPGAMCVTYLGRCAIQKAGKLARDKYEADWIYTDTDSTYIIFPSVTSVDEIWDRAIIVAKEISSKFPGSITLEFEQVIYSKFLILAKKKYLYAGIDKNGIADGRVGRKGVVIARRDNSNFLRFLYEKIVSMLFDNYERDSIENLILEYINDSFRNVIASSEYIVTKSIRSTDNDSSENGYLGDYKVKSLPSNSEERDRLLNGMTERQYMITKCPGQVQLAEKMRLRGCPVDVGSRMEYVILERPKKKKSIGSKMEDYDYYLKRKNNLKLDKFYYLDSLINPIDKLLRVAYEMNQFIKSQSIIRKKYQHVLLELKHLYKRKIRIVKRCKAI